MAHWTTNVTRDSSLPENPDLMNDPDFATNSAAGEDGGEADTCRICRGEATAPEPLFHPCKCSGSIKFVHQDCLMEWLSHSQKKYCELCKTPFRFTKLYSPNMPPKIPMHVFVKHLMLQVLKNLATWLRACLVAFVWLGVLPWLMRNVWGLLFWFGDGGWTPNDSNISANLTSLNNENTTGLGHSILGNSTSPARHVLANLAPPTSVADLQSMRPVKLNWTSPLTLGFFDVLLYGLSFFDFVYFGFYGLLNVPNAPHNITESSGYSGTVHNQITVGQERPSLLSEVGFLKNLTRYEKVNGVVISILEGQIITIIVVVCFVLVFLIREWVVQQQPGINMGAGFNAEFAGRNIEARPDPVPEAVREPEVVAEDNDRRGRPIARPRRRQVRFEENPAVDIDQRQENVIAANGETPTAHLAPEEQDQTLANLNQGSPSGALPEATETRLESTYFIDVWRRAGGDTDEILRLIDEEGLGEKLNYWKGTLAALRARQGQASNSFGAAAGDDSSRDTVDSSSQSGSWADIPDTPSDIDHQEDPKPPSEGASPTSINDKGKGRAMEVTMSDSSADLTEPDPGSHRWTKEELDRAYQDKAPDSDDYEPLEIRAAKGKTRSSIFENPSGRPRAISDGPVVPSFISSLGNNSWSFPEQAALNAVAQDNNGKDSLLIRSEDEPREDKSQEVEFREQREAARESIDESFVATTVPRPASLSEGVPDQTIVHNGEEDLTNSQDHSPAEETNNPFHPDGLLPDDAHLLDAAAPIVPPPENIGILGNVANWLWGDANVLEDVDAVDDEHIVQDLAVEEPFVPVNRNVGNMPPEGQDDEPDEDRNHDIAQDQRMAEALAEDADAMDAIEDGEDFEGIMELVGMRGPLTQLFQNGLFSVVLISLTVACGVWMPYNFGRLFLLLLANPTQTIKIPLKVLYSSVAILQDLALILLGGLSWAFVQAISWIRSGSYSFGPDSPVNGIPSWMGAAFELTKMANSALDRIIGITVESIVRLTASEVPAFSAMSHEALIYIKIVVSEAFQLLTFLLTATAQLPEGKWTLSGVGNLREFRELAINLWEMSFQYSRTLLSALSSTDTWIMTPDSSLHPYSADPLLSYWGGTDRFWAILAGYIALTFIGCAYLKRNSPFSTSQAGREWEATIVDALNQAGGVMKVILIISIEMLVFPLYCGLLLDLALLPLFDQATIFSRLLFTIETPFTSIFVHWFVGTCYMFHFALFVSMCRKIMRPGVLYFIRDPDDPTFHPVRDVLERNVTTQLRKIAFSALVYGAMVVVCLGGVVWSLALAFKGVLPIHWSSNEPVLQFPIDLLFYNFFMPLAVKFFKPSDGLHAMYNWWFHKCARILRLTWFLFGKRMVDEEGHRPWKGWESVLGSTREIIIELCKLDIDEREPESDAAIETEVTNRELGNDWEMDGKYVRTPASDQVRIPKDREVFIEVDINNRRIDGIPEGNDTGADINYKKVYIPPAFRIRIFLFILFIWLFAAVTGVCLTLIPLVVGRMIFAKIIPSHIRKNDVYAFAIGTYILGSILYCAVHLREGIKYCRRAIAVNQDTPRVVSRRVSFLIIRGLRIIYAYTAFVVVLPTLLTLAVEFYFIIPLHTFFYPSEPHIIHFVQSWTLGLLYVKIGTQLILWHNNSRPAEALRAVTRNGYLNPDIRLATRAFVLPASFILTLALGVPLCMAGFANMIGVFGRDPEVQMKVYRYAYPMVLSAIVHLFGMWAALDVLKGWQMKTRDEVYLIGERLHNFGDRSRSGAGGVGALVPAGTRIET